MGTRCDNSGTASIATKHAGSAADNREHHALGQHLPHQSFAPRPECRAHGELPLTPGRAHQEQVGEVGAHQQEETETRAAQREEHYPVSRQHEVTLPEEREPGLGVRLGVIALEPCRDGRELGACLLERRAGCEPADRLEVRVVAIGVVILSQHERRPELHVRRREMKACRHDPDDHTRRVVEPDRLSEHTRVAPELRLPESVRQHDRSRVAVVGRGVEHPAHQRANAEDREHFGRDEHAGEVRRLADADEVDLVAGERTPSARFGGHGGRVAEVRRGQLVHASPAASLFRTLAEPDELVRARERQWAQQHEIRDRERRGVGADAEGGDEHHRGDEAARATHGADGVVQVLAQDGPVGGDRVRHDVANGGEGGGETAPPARGLGERAEQLRFVLEAVGRRIEAQQSPVDRKTHGRFTGVSDDARFGRGFPPLYPLWLYCQCIQ